MIKARNIISKLFISGIFISAMALHTSCSKDDSNDDNNGNNGGNGGTGNSSAPYFKGQVNGNWPHGCVLHTNGTARYLLSFTGGSMSDTANVNMTKYEGTYTEVAANDSIYINCADTTNGTYVSLKGVYNTAHTSITGTWRFESGGIINTVPFAMAK